MQSNAYSGWPAPGARPVPAAAAKAAAKPVDLPPLVADDPRLAHVKKALEQAQERADFDHSTIEKLLAENKRLAARIAEMEVPGAAPMETGGAVGIPAAPGALEDASIGDIVDAADAQGELDGLRRQAQALGIHVDLRWGYKRLAREIAQAENLKS